MSASTATKKSDDKNRTENGTMDRVEENVKEAVDQGKQLARDVAEGAVKTADKATAAAGRGAQSVASTMREYGPSNENMLGKATEKVADAIEQGGQYLEEQGISGAVDDVANMIKRNPIPAMLVGIGIGYLVARATTPRSYT